MMTIRINAFGFMIASILLFMYFFFLREFTFEHFGDVVVGFTIAYVYAWCHFRGFGNKKNKKQQEQERENNASKNSNRKK